MSRPTTNVKVTQLSKNTTPPSTYNTLFYQILNNLPPSTTCRTDGTKTPYIAGYAFTVVNTTVAQQHHNSTTVLNTELQAIYHRPVHLLLNLHQLIQSALIASYFLAAFSAVSNINSPHPLVNHTQTLISTLSKTNTFISIPAHKGISGNKIVEKMAEEAASLCQ